MNFKSHSPSKPCKSACVRLEEVRARFKLIHDLCILTCQNTNTSLQKHIVDFQRKENKNDHFFPAWEIYFMFAAQMWSKSSRAEQKS